MDDNKWREHLVEACAYPGHYDYIVPLEEFLPREMEGLVERFSEGKSKLLSEKLGAPMSLFGSGDIEAIWKALFEEEGEGYCRFEVAEKWIDYSERHYENVFFAGATYREIDEAMGVVYEQVYHDFDWWKETSDSKTTKEVSNG